jgi:hypothetical protein
VKEVVNEIILSDILDQVDADPSVTGRTVVAICSFTVTYPSNGQKNFAQSMGMHGGKTALLNKSLTLSVFLERITFYVY